MNSVKCLSQIHNFECKTKFFSKQNPFIALSFPKQADFFLRITIIWESNNIYCMIKWIKSDKDSKFLLSTNKVIRKWKEQIVI